jgi:hypothetical protein
MSGPEPPDEPCPLTRLESLGGRHRLAPAHSLQVLAVDHLVDDQDLRELIEEPAVAGQHLGRPAVGLVHQARRLLVDERRQVVRELG